MQKNPISLFTQALKRNRMAKKVVAVKRRVMRKKRRRMVWQGVKARKKKTRVKSQEKVNLVFVVK